MPHGRLINLGLMTGVAAFAVLTSISNTAALATAGGLALCAGATRRLEDLPRLGLLAIVALVPMSFIGTFVAVGSLDSLTKLVFLPAFGVLIMNRVIAHEPLVFGRQSLFVLLFAVALTLSYLVNEHSGYSLWFLFRFVSVLLLFLLGANALRTERDLKLLLGVMVGACVLSVLGATFVPVLAAPNSTMLDGNLVRMTGWSTYDAPTFGTDLMVSLLIVLHFAFLSSTTSRRLGLLAIGAVLLLAIAYTYVRGVTVVSVLSMAFLCFKLRRRIPLFRVVVVVSILLVCLLPFVPDFFWERMLSMITSAGTDPTMGRRLDSYRIGLQLFASRPLLGFGPGNFIMQYMSPEFRFDNSAIPSVCFNLYLSIATQAGLLGLAAFGGIVWAAFHELHVVVKSHGDSDAFLRQVAELLEVLLVAFLLVSLFEPTDLQKGLWVVFGAAAAVSHIRHRQLAAPPSSASLQAA